jgi:hypothetical protein
MRISLTKIMLVALLILLTTPGLTVIVHAQTAPGTDKYTLLEPLPCYQTNGVSCPSGGNGNTESSVDLQQYVQYFFNMVIALSAAAAVFMIAAGGLQYMTTDSWQGKSDGKDRVKNAVIGLLMVLCSYLILQTINPQLVNIPSTLVTPLGITPTTTTPFFTNQSTNNNTSQNDNSPSVKSGVFDSSPVD